MEKTSVFNDLCLVAANQLKLGEMSSLLWKKKEKRKTNEKLLSLIDCKCGGQWQSDLQTLLLTGYTG